MNTFERPLTAEEEQKCLKEYGDGGLSARNLLIERNMRLVAHIAKKYTYTGYDMEDILSIGTIGLIKAITTFDPNKGNRLATYAARCIDNEILMMLRSDKKRSRDVSLYNPVGIDKEGNEISLLEVIVTKDRDLCEQVMMSTEIEKLEKVFTDALKEKEKLVLIKRYGLFRTREYTQKEIAKELNISRSYVSRIEKAAIEHLRKAMEKEG